MDGDCTNRITDDLKKHLGDKCTLMVKCGTFFNGTIQSVQDGCVVLKDYFMDNRQQDSDLVLTIVLEHVVAYAMVPKSSNFNNMKSLSGSVID